MSAAHMLSKPARRCLAQRLERLHEALSGLARRLHESIASVVGEHAGGAIRDAVRAALGHATNEPPPEPPPYRRPSYYDPYRDDDEDERYRRDDPYRERERPNGLELSSLRGCSSRAVLDGPRRERFGALPRKSASATGSDNARLPRTPTPPW